MLDQIIKERIEFIGTILTVFKNELEPGLPARFRRGPLQGQILKRLSLPRTGPNMKAINEAMKLAGYSMIVVNGWSHYKKVA